MPSDTGTPRTKEELMNIFRDDQPRASITPKDIRDLVESVATGAIQVIAVYVA